MKAGIIFFGGGVDGNHLFTQLKFFKSFYLDGPNLLSYCKRHLCPDEEIYRIFYYDAPPLERIGKTPLGTEVDFSASSTAEKMKQRFEPLRTTPYIGLRLGRTAWHNDWALATGALSDLLKGTKSLAKLCDADFIPNIKQKAVDMKIGLDIATIAFKKLASRIVIIGGDSDFAPATKLARTEGLHVTHDTVGAKPSAELTKHVDWLSSSLDPQKAADVPKHASNFVNNIKTL